MASANEVIANTTFSMLRGKIGDPLLDSIEAMGFKQPTEIQAKTLPHLLLGKDLIGAARTGSGKTLAFLIPVVELLNKLRFLPRHGTGCIILTPTRELAMQIAGVLEKIVRRVPLSFGLVLGGTKKEVEVRKLMKGCNIVVATPGRLLDHLVTTPEFNVDNLKVFVMDEADKLLDAGFERDIKKIIQRIPSERQTVLFSATITDKIQNLANLAMVRERVYVTAINKQESSTNEGLTQGSVHNIYSIRNIDLAIFNSMESEFNECFVTSVSQLKSSENDVIKSWLPENRKCFDQTRYFTCTERRKSEIDVSRLRQFYTCESFIPILFVRAHAEQPQSKVKNIEIGTKVRRKKNLKINDIKVTVRDTTPMNKEKFKVVREEILKKILTCVNGCAPRFLSCQIKNGRFEIVCADESTLKWLNEVVNNMKPWPDANLSTVCLKGVQKEKVIELNIPLSENPGNVLDYLKLQNKGLNVHLWMLVERRVYAIHQTSFYSIDEDSYKALHDQEFKVYCGLRKILVYICSDREMIIKSQKGKKKKKACRSKIEMSTIV